MSSLQDMVTLVTKNPAFLDKLSAENVNMHCDTVYTGSRIRICHPVTTNPDGRIAYVHWGCDKGMYVSFEDCDRNELVPLNTGIRFVVNQQCVKEGALRVLKREGTDEIQDNNKPRNRKQEMFRHERVLKNDIIFRFPTSTQQLSYECRKFKTTCFCELKLRPKLFFCAESNINNSNRPYYGCRNRLTRKSNCDFFAWETEFDHGIDKVCNCGRHCKRIEYPKGTSKYFLVCFKKNKGGCHFFHKV